VEAPSDEAAEPQTSPSPAPAIVEAQPAVEPPPALQAGQRSASVGTRIRGELERAYRIAPLAPSPTAAPMLAGWVPGFVAPISPVAGLGDIAMPATSEPPSSPAGGGTLESSPPRPAAGADPPGTKPQQQLPAQHDALGLGAAALGGTAAPERTLGLLAVLSLFLFFFVDGLRRVTGVWSPPSAELGRPPERPG
jgi:hypothetical protein